MLPRLPRLRLAGLLTRELSIAEATFILMASFLVSALLGAVRQVLFNAAFGAGPEASAYYAAFRLPDTLFSLIAGGALSSAMIPVLLRTIQEDGAVVALALPALLGLIFLGRTIRRCCWGSCCCSSCGGCWPINQKVLPYIGR